MSERTEIIACAKLHVVNTGKVIDDFLSFFSKRFKDVLLKLLTLQTLKRNLKQFRNSKIDYK